MVNVYGDTPMFFHHFSHKKNCGILITSPEEDVVPIGVYSILTEKNWFLEKHILHFNPTALRMAETPASFGRSECNRVKS